MAKNSNSQHKEGKVAKTIEDQTAKLPSDVFLWTAISAMGASLGLQIAGRKHTSLFIGQWVAPILLFGIYNKLVKQQGHDKTDKGGSKDELSEDGIGSFSSMSRSMA